MGRVQLVGNIGQGRGVGLGRFIGEDRGLY